jgi:hypothetical protein
LRVSENRHKPLILLFHPTPEGAMRCPLKGDNNDIACSSPRRIDGGIAGSRTGRQGWCHVCRMNDAWSAAAWDEREVCT